MGLQNLIQYQSYIRFQKQNQKDNYQSLTDKLRGVGLRATRQRLDIGSLLFSGKNRHVTAESLHDEAVASGMKISLATIYNALNQFTDAGLLREVLIDPSRTYFDTNTSSHHHFFNIDIFFIFKNR